MHHQEHKKELVDDLVPTILVIQGLAFPSETQEEVPLIHLSHDLPSHDSEEAAASMLWSRTGCWESGLMKREGKIVKIEMFTIIMQFP